MRTEIPALAGMIDNEIDNRLRRANVPTNEQTTRSIPLERAERALDAQNDRSLENGAATAGWACWAARLIATNGLSH